MEKENPRERIARQKALNEEHNPRVTIMGEATQGINPITGKSYDFIPEKYCYPIYHISFEKNKRCFPFIKTIEEKFNLYPIRFEEESLSVIERQKSLARMEVRDGKMDLLEYSDFLKNLDLLCGAYI